METSPSATDARSIIEPLFRGKFWMQLIGVMMIVSMLFGVGMMGAANF